MSGQPSHLKALLRLGLASLAQRQSGGETAGEPSPRCRAAAEAAAIAIDAARLGRFLSVTDGESVQWGAGAEALLPPTYSAVWETALMLDLFRTLELGLPLRGLIHLESEMLQIRPLRATDSVRCRVEMDAREPHSRGTVIRLISRNWNAPGQLCQENSMALLVMDRSSGSARGRRKGSTAAAAESDDPASWNRLAEWRLNAAYGRRYARASGDFNPIHLWGWSARLFGYNRPILHGYCIEAMVANALVRSRMNGDPTLLRRLRIAFRAPALLPARLELETRGREFRVMHEASGRRRLIAEGEFVGGGEMETREGR